MTHKHYLITGATSGIGLATAKALAAEGHQLYITGRDGSRLAQAKADIGHLNGRDVATLLCDSGNLEQIDAMAQALKADGVTLDGVVLNAGIFFPQAFAQLTEANLDQTMDVNFKGPMFTLHSLLPCLNNPASVVFTSSVAVCKGFAGGAVYSASKAAFEAAARVMNLELAGQGIRVNSVRPGVTATEIQGKAGMSDEQITELFAGMKSIPLGRVLAAGEMVPAIRYLLGDESVGLRNAHIDIDGGFAL